MRAVVVGNGLAGTIAAKTIRELDAGSEIIVFAEEKHPYYPRPNLVEFLAGRLPFEKLFAFPADWAERMKIDMRLGVSLKAVHPGGPAVETDGGEIVPCDALLLANGARAAIPPIKGADGPDVYVLRTLDDALEIQKRLEDGGRVAVIGGGLLGLEIARALGESGTSVRVIEFFERLLPRQLDDRGSRILSERIAKMGIDVHLGAVTEEIRADATGLRLRLKDGREYASDIVIAASGVCPRIEPAAAAGLKTRKGVVVDDTLMTGAPGVYAAGDVAEHSGRSYGIIPAAFEQARVAAHNMLGSEKKYEGTVPFTTLKVVGLAVTSVGDVEPESDRDEVLFREQPEEGIYKKILIRDGVVAGAVWMGTRKGAAEIAKLAARKASVKKWKNELLDDAFDFSVV
jgi:nitrite reductase (NADH) large subunit